MNPFGMTLTGHVCSLSLPYTKGRAGWGFGVQPVFTRVAAINTSPQSPPFQGGEENSNALLVSFPHTDTTT
ncbi:protein of unknown function [Nitrospina watsonii]|uniref:Uncharacterized protein n=1 Tax=Nitrospina watsonii TaxID=1323948 RepID=A0ABM9H9Y6_9BACT|nr:protein of unknown function [Nitrospina watsonii]